MAFGRNAQHVLATGGPAPAVFDEMRVWSTVRSDAEIQANHRVFEIPSVAALQSMWHLNEGSGPNLPDSTGHNHAGLMVGAAWTSSDLWRSGPPFIKSITASGNAGGADISAVVNPAGSATTAFLQYGSSA